MSSSLQICWHLDSFCSSSDFLLFWWIFSSCAWNWLSARTWRLPSIKEFHSGREGLLQQGPKCWFHLSRPLSTSIEVHGSAGNVDSSGLLEFDSGEGLKVFNCWRHCLTLIGHIPLFLKACQMILFLKVFLRIVGRFWRKDQMSYSILSSARESWITTLCQCL